MAYSRSGIHVVTPTSAKERFSDPSKAIVMLSGSWPSRGGIFPPSLSSDLSLEGSCVDAYDGDGGAISVDADDDDELGAYEG
jgi:hypothetical protein